jgi:hypothetical protein
MRTCWRDCGHRDWSDVKRHRVLSIVFVAATILLATGGASSAQTSHAPPVYTPGGPTGERTGVGVGIDVRLAVMVIPFLMPLDVVSAVQRRGLWLFVMGVLLYVFTWVPLMVAPESAWSTSRAGFRAPAYTPLVWLADLGLSGSRLYWALAFKPWMYLLVATGFVAVHVAHASLVYTRT